MNNDWDIFLTNPSTACDKDYDGTVPRENDLVALTISVSAADLEPSSDWCLEFWCDEGAGRVRGWKEGTDGHRDALANSFTFPPDADTPWEWTGDAIWAGADGWTWDGANDRLRLRLLNRTPRFGNDDDRADAIAQSIFNMYFETVDGVPNDRGGEHRMDVLSTTVHVHFGSKLGASPDGRLSGLPISEGISPVQGADMAGPTAVMKSVAKLNHRVTGGTLLNQKFTPQLLKTAEDIEKFAKLIRSYFKLGGHHVQFNVVNRKTLEEAKKDPEAYRSLIVRVAGYSDYFRDLNEGLQNEIIARTEHVEF